MAGFTPGHTLGTGRNHNTFITPQSESGERVKWACAAAAAAGKSPKHKRLLFYCFVNA